MWCVPELTAEYIDKMNNILRLYEQPSSAKNPVICVDEKPVQLKEDFRPGKSLRPGKTSLRDYEYKRKGTANIFVAVEPKRGRHFTKVTKSRKAVDFAEFLSDLSKRYRYTRRISLILDNLNIHSKASLVKRYGLKHGEKLWNRFDVHYTPKHASWLNQAEIEISLISRECLGKKRIGSIEILQDQIAAWSERATSDKRVIKWNFSREKAKKKFRLTDY